MTDSPSGPGNRPPADEEAWEPLVVPRETPLLDWLTAEELGVFGLPDPGEYLKRPEVSEEDDSAQGLFKRGQAYVLESIRRAQSGEVPDVSAGERLVARMAGSLERGTELLLLATEREQEFAVSLHCVNVSILAVKIGCALEYDQQRLARVGLAGLLHEVGVVKLPENLLHRAGEVSEEVRRRPIYSSEILQGLPERYHWLGEIALQVYEREDGSGFPHGLKGRQIREESKVLGIADVLDACLHIRPYRRPMTGYQLLSELTSGGARAFSSRIARALLKSFSVYPYNEYVILSTGELARVIDINADNPLRPRVVILYDSSGEEVEPPREIDLCKNPSLSISRAIPCDHVPGR